MDIATQMRNLTPKIQINHLGLLEGIFRPDMLPAFPMQQLDDVTGKSIEAPTNTEGNSVEANTSDLVSQAKAQAPDESPTGDQNSHVILSPKPQLAQTPSQLTYQAALVQYEKDVKAAFQRLDYSEGYPTLQGTPFWSQFTFEPVEAFICFEAYLEQGRFGARQMFAIPEDARFSKFPDRPSLAFLDECFHTYYWAQRAKSYDMFFAAHRRKERERRAIETEDLHYLQGSKLMTIVNAYLDANGEELVETMTPKAFLEMLKTAVQLQRMSTGLSANGGNQSDQVSPAGASLELIMRSISQQSKAMIPDDIIPDAVDSDGKTVENSDKLARILANPETLKLAQELIIRVNPVQPPGGF